MLQISRPLIREKSCFVVLQYKSKCMHNIHVLGSALGNVLHMRKIAFEKYMQPNQMELEAGSLSTSIFVYTSESADASEIAIHVRSLIPCDVSNTENPAGRCRQNDVVSTSLRRHDVASTLF